MSKVILSLCDYSGRWSQPYRDAGYMVFQIDLKKGKDVRMLEKLDCEVHGILAAPPCTEFSSAGARWWKKKEEEQPQLLRDNIAIVDACLRSVVVYKPKWWVLENPVGRLQRWIGKKNYTFQPHDFAGWLPEDEQHDEQYTKETWLWGEFNEPDEKSLPPVQGSKMWAKYGGKSERTKEMRSMTPKGFALAFFNANK